MSSSNSSFVYGRLSSSPLTYQRSFCNKPPCSGSKTAIHVSDAGLNRGKLYYTCRTCASFCGWCVADEEQLPLPGITVKRSPSAYRYKPVNCPVEVCGKQTVILVSTTTKNPGKLFYKCECCDLWLHWCAPQEKVATERGRICGKGYADDYADQNRKYDKIGSTVPSVECLLMCIIALLGVLIALVLLKV